MQCTSCGTTLEANVLTCPACGGPTTPPAQQAPTAYQPQPSVQPGWNILAIVGFVLSFVLTIPGLIVSIVAMGQCKKKGEKGHGLALAGVIVSILITLFYAGLLAVSIASIAAVVADPSIMEAWTTPDMLRF